MEMVELPIHEHPLLSVTRFSIDSCKGCGSDGYIYGGYRCNQFGCEEYMFHKECAELLPEINHSSHPDHPLKLIPNDPQLSTCSRCGIRFRNGYLCSICDFKLDIRCAKGPARLLILENSNLHEHPLQLSCGQEPYTSGYQGKCKVCENAVYDRYPRYRCYQCELFFHEECAKFFPEANHTSHPQHPLKLLSYKAIPDYADKECLLCGMNFDQRLHHCDVCNFSICRGCMSNPPPLVVVSRTTHEHQLHLVPRCIDFTCNACGTQGDRSPYFCLQCNFMIHWECIDLPRVININRHNHRIAYTHRLGHGEWKCAVGFCSKKVDGFYGAYSCSKCHNYVVHSICATSNDVWDMIELEGTHEEPEEPPFVVIDDNTIKHFSHDHNLRINKDGRMLHDESILCQACVFQICSEPFYSCEPCDFILHKQCANLPRKKRHVSHNQQLTLDMNAEGNASTCRICDHWFTGFRYYCRGFVLDVRCSSISEPFVHESHRHPLYYTGGYSMSKSCTACGDCINRAFFKALFNCDECDFRLDFKCAILPHKVMRHRYDDHPLFLSFGESSVDGEYWCEACETKLNPRKWFYTCKDCGVTLHISCVVADFSYMMPGSKDFSSISGSYEGEVVPNTSICRLICTVCNSRCKLPSIFMDSRAGYVCSSKCRDKYNRKNYYVREDMMAMMD